eukprot:TRINITY_DN18816_c0_g1_i1.p1 TRINITY_DN18816_c0_g1~~TRINITY_DN18816_c0_g1_i1.p1  ORF type:complete len:102 (-),score=6.93 TRINITY_DN18816_c0_g1_i1:53-358(-)
MADKNASHRAEEQALGSANAPTLPKKLENSSFSPEGCVRSILHSTDSSEIKYLYHFGDSIRIVLVIEMRFVRNRRSIIKFTIRVVSESLSFTAILGNILTN